MTQGAAVRTGIALLRAGRPVQISGAVPMTVAAVETVTQELLDLIDRHRPARLVIDGIGRLRDAVVNVERDLPFTAALLHDLKARGVTTLMTEELPLYIEGSNHTATSAAFVENIVHLKYDQRREMVTRSLTLVKVRDGDHDSSVRPYRISSAGFALANIENHHPAVSLHTT